MPRTRKSSGQPPANQDPPNPDQSDSATMAHVSADELAGSPDVFAAKPSSSSNAEATTHEEVTAEADMPAASAWTPDPPTTASEPVIVPLEPPAAGVPPPPPPRTPPPPPARRNGTGVALGVVLVVLGLFYFVVQVAGINLDSFGWPLFIIIPGLTLLVVGFISFGTGAAGLTRGPWSHRAASGWGCSCRVCVRATRA